MASKKRTSNIQSYQRELLDILLPVTVNCVVLLNPVPSALTAKQVYNPVSDMSEDLNVSEGVTAVLPFVPTALAFIVVNNPLLLDSQ